MCLPAGLFLLCASLPLSTSAEEHCSTPAQQRSDSAQHQPGEDHSEATAPSAGQNRSDTLHLFRNAVENQTRPAKEDYTS